ncbi:crosslink repair DNA glycosylase YcaQ family protein [Intrasporangium sp.]|uniref:DNA glycosylase AlkZ-like family protein n=1 Tax=Intrasporangium sp. TaxID=1925024 RepID=UPI003221AECB
MPPKAVPQDPAVRARWRHERLAGLAIAPPPGTTERPAVAERHLRSHGPVTERDLAGWANQRLGAAREAPALLGDRVVRHEVHGQVWLRHVEGPGAAGRAAEHEHLAQRQPGPGGSERGPEEDTPRVQLLPQWDEFLLGYQTRDVVLPPEHVARVVPGRNAVFRPTVVVDGEVAGVWRRTTSGRRTVVEVELLRRPTASLRRALEAGTAAYGRLLGRPAELRIVGA